MIRSFQEVIDKVKQMENRRVAVPAAHDEAVLEAIRDAAELNIADAVLVGDKPAIERISKEIGLDLKNVEIIDEKDNIKASLIAVSLVSGGMADMVMKGLVDSATFLRAVLDKEKGLRAGKVLSHVAVFEMPALQKMLLLTDAAINISPDLLTKKQILENAVKVAHAIGMKLPKVAPVCAVEVVNMDMPATIDAAILSKMNDRGQIKGCIVDGPLAVDNALSEESARHKGIQSPVAGHADIILVPNLDTGNAMYKTMTFLSNSKPAAILAGASAPVILTSRADAPESKMNSIALAALVASNLNKGE